MPGSFEAEIAVQHCSDGAGVVSGDYLPRAGMLDAANSPDLTRKRLISGVGSHRRSSARTIPLVPPER